MKKRAFSKAFLASGTIDPLGNVFRLRLAGINLDYPLNGPKRDQSYYPVIFEDKKTSQWFQVATYGDVFFTGQGENNQF